MPPPHPIRSLLPLVLVAGCGAGPSGPEPTRQVILVSLDTLRADHLSAYGYGRPTSPELEAFAASDAVLFEHCYAHASWTLPSHMSIFTGLYPSVHGVGPPETRLAPTVWTMPEILKAEGLATAGFTDGGYVEGLYGFADGFDEYHGEELGDAKKVKGLARTMPFAEAWLRKNAGRDFFMFLHTYDSHAPFEVEAEFLESFYPEVEPSPEGLEQLEYLKGLEEHDYYELDDYTSMEQFVAAYDGTIRYTDHQMGRLFALLRELGIYERCMIVITSDHGESLLDLGVYAGHGAYLHDAETHVPLLVKYPANHYGGARSGAMVESIDILPTVLSALRIGAPADTLMQGHDLTGLLEGEADPSPYSVSCPGNLQFAALRTLDWTYLSNVDEEIVQEFITGRLRPYDPTWIPMIRARIDNVERLMPTGGPPDSNERDSQPEMLHLLKDALHKWQLGQFQVKALVEQPEKRGELTPEQTERLRQLGYL